jgi:hypothetical protein
LKAANTFKSSGPKKIVALEGAISKIKIYWRTDFKPNLQFKVIISQTVFVGLSF